MRWLCRVSTVCLLAVGLLTSAATVASAADAKLKALIVDGQNNHGNWPQTTQMMKRYLEESGLFAVDVATTAPKGTDPSFKPEFAKYDVVVSNYNGADWPEQTKTAFIDYVKGGGGLVIIHAANNSFGNWREYNEMIGVGGWGGRNEKSGPYVYLDEAGKVVRDTSPGGGGHHGPQHPFQIIIRDGEHPITRGVPREWMHMNDELYDKLRGPGENMEVLATAFADPKKGGSGRHEPMLMTLTYGKGRIFHTPMGHGNDSQECVGFITFLQRGAEWAATGKVTSKVPDDFPAPDKTSQRKFGADKK
jgi:type 1 glutamine amidotransferase